MSRSLARLFLASSLAFLLTGCGGNWLIGEWTLDKERTLEEITTASEPVESSDPGEGLLRDIVGGFQKGISRVLLAQFEGVVVEFTATEVRRIRDGVGTTQTYEILEKPEAGVYLVKTANGNVVTWAKTDDGIRMKLGDEGGTWVYFVPAESK